MAERASMPHSMEAEQCVLGSLMLDNANAEAVGTLLTEGDFYVEQHAKIWRAIHQMLAQGEPADVITVYERLRASNEVDSKWLAYLNDMVQQVPGTGRNVAQYARIVRRRSMRRAVARMAGDLAEQVTGLDQDTDEALADVVDRTVAALLATRGNWASDEPRLVADLLPAWVDELNDRAQGKTDAMSTGLADLDRLLAGGLRRGELMVVGARPSMGKSALMLVMARRMAEQGPVLAISLEDSDRMLVSRLVASAGRANLADIRVPQRAPQSMWECVTAGMDRVVRLPLYVDDQPALPLREVRRKAMQVMRREGDLRMVVVDYLQLMEGEGENRAYELAAIARGLKRLAKELNCAFLLLSQLSREADKIDGPPRIDHLAESGGVEQAADIIGLLWRKGRKSRDPMLKHHAQVEIVKQKNGPTGTVELHFDGATQTFADVAQVDTQE